MNGSLAIETLGLTKRYGERAVVDHLDLRVPEGVVFGFLGANGAGKSTTLGMLTGGLHPTSGEMLVNGLSPVRDLQRLKHMIGFMPQHFSLYSYMTVSENLSFYANLYLSSYREARQRTAEMLATTGLADYRQQSVARLSGGWRQRLALACALVHRPRILFLDEPTAAVDPVSRRLFWDLLHELNDGGVTIFITTHYIEEVERCHLVGLMAEGRLRALESPSELKGFINETCELIKIVTDRPEQAFNVLKSLPDLIDIYLYGDAIYLTWAFHVDGLALTRTVLEAAKIPVSHILKRTATMEDVFVQAMGTEAAR